MHRERECLGHCSLYVTVLGECIHKIFLFDSLFSLITLQPSDTISVALGYCLKQPGLGEYVCVSLPGVYSDMRLLACCLCTSDLKSDFLCQQCPHATVCTVT